jgi:hypothetical protein
MTWAVFAVFLLVWSLPTEAATVSSECFSPSLQLYQNERDDARRRRLPLKYPERQHYELYRLVLLDLKPGDIVQVSAQFQVTNDLDYVSSLSHYITVHGRYVLPLLPVGENVTPNPGTHHGHRALSGHFQVTESGTHVVKLMAYAASTRQRDGDYLWVERRGGMSALVFRCEEAGLQPQESTSFQ